MSEPFSVSKIAKEIFQAGGSSYFVGGCVRDRMMHRILGYPLVDPKDIDIEVHGLSQDELKEILSKYGSSEEVGKSFGVFKFHKNCKWYDFSLPRTEKQTGKKHQDLEVEFPQNITLTQASERRDLTINQIMWNCLTHEIIDCHGGMQDIACKTLRMVNKNTFLDDALRLLRLVKFQGRFPEFRVDQETFSLAQTNASLVSNLPNDRIFGEISDILLKSPKPSVAFNLMYNLGIMDAFLPELSITKFIEQNPLYHPEKYVYPHLMYAIDYEPMETRTLPVMLAKLFHDIRKSNDPEENKIHAVRGAEWVEREFPLRFTTNKELIKEVSTLVRHHMAFFNLPLDKKHIRRLALKVDVPSLIKVNEADRLSRPFPEDQFDQIFKTKDELKKIASLYCEVKNEIDPIIFGRDIQENYNWIKPGPIFGKIIHRVYVMQIDGEFSDREGGLIALDKVIEEMKRELDEVS